MNGKVTEEEPMKGMLIVKCEQKDVIQYNVVAILEIWQNMVLFKSDL